MAVDRLRALAARPPARARGADWSPARHRVDRRARRSPSCCPRSPTARPTGGYLFYDCQTDDARLVLTVLAEAERFGAVAANRLEARRAAARRAAARSARACATSRPATELEVRAANVVNATGVWADRLRPGELHDEAEVPVIRP